MLLLKLLVSSRFSTYLGMFHWFPKLKPWLRKSKNVVQLPVGCQTALPWLCTLPDDVFYGIRRFDLCLVKIWITFSPLPR